MDKIINLQELDIFKENYKKIVDTKMYVDKEGTKRAFIDKFLKLLNFPVDDPINYLTMKYNYSQNVKNEYLNFEFDYEFYYEDKALINIISFPLSESLDIDEIFVKQCFNLKKDLKFLFYMNGKNLVVFKKKDDEKIIKYFTYDLLSPVQHELLFSIDYNNLLNLSFNKDREIFKLKENKMENTYENHVKKLSNEFLEFFNHLLKEKNIDISKEELVDYLKEKMNYEEESELMNEELIEEPMPTTINDERLNPFEITLYMIQKNNSERFEPYQVLLNGNKIRLEKRQWKEAYKVLIKYFVEEKNIDVSTILKTTIYNNENIFPSYIQKEDICQFSNGYFLGANASQQKVLDDLKIICWQNNIEYEVIKR